MKLIVYMLMAVLTINSAMALEKLDQPGIPNEDGQEIIDKLKNKEMSLEMIYSYFSHYSPVIRKSASEAMATRGEEAMPYIIKALKTGKKYEGRAACDAITGTRSFFGMDVKKADYPIKTAMVVKVMPDILPLLDNRDVYVRAGALQALSRCGKAAAPSLGRVAALLKDDEWWIREGASCVMEGVGSPEVDPYLEALVIAQRDEIHVQCYNFLHRRLVSLAAVASQDTKDKLAVLLVNNIPKIKYPPFKKWFAFNALNSMKTDGKAALPLLDQLIEKQEKLVANFKKDYKPMDDEERFLLKYGGTTRYDQEKGLLESMKATRHILAGTKP